MSKLNKLGAEAWPVSRAGTSHRPVLEEIVVESEHPAGHGVVHLSTDQALYAQSRLSHIAVAFLDGHTGSVQHLGVDHLPTDHRSHLSQCAAKVWPISHEEGGQPPVLEQVVIESEHPTGYGIIHLSPEQARYIHNRLSQITTAFLHENIWGGEAIREQ